MCLCLLQVVSLLDDKMPVDWNSEHMQKWRDLTKEKQQEYYDSPHIVKWRDCKISLFDVSEKEAGENFTNKQLKHIRKIFGSIKKSKKKYKYQENEEKHEDENIRVSVLLVLVKAGDNYTTLPVINLSKNGINIQKDYNIFIDFCGRVYKNWQDYLKNNTLPNCVLCYPKNGVYSVVDGVVEVEYGISPAGKRGRKFLRRLDIVGTVLGVAAVVVALAAWFVPVAFPVVAG